MKERKKKKKGHSTCSLQRKLWWPRGIMGFTRSFRNLQGKFFDYDCNVQLSTAIQLFVISASTTQSLFSTLNCGSNFQPRSRFSTLSCDSNFQPRFSFSTLKWDCNFQLRLQLSSGIQLFNAQVRLQLSTTIRLFNAQLRFQLPSAEYFFNARFRLLPQYIING